LIVGHVILLMIVCLVSGSSHPEFATDWFLLNQIKMCIKSWKFETIRYVTSNIHKY